MGTDWAWVDPALMGLLGCSADRACDQGPGRTVLTGVPFFFFLIFFFCVYVFN